jgi:transposase
VLQARQVSTQPERVLAFFAKRTRDCIRTGESFIAVLEVCGFNDGLIRWLHDDRCHKVILIQPEERKPHKTDRRDAAALSELLRGNRERFLAGKPVRGLRQVGISSSTDQENRRLTTVRQEASQTRTRLINKIKHLLRRHHLQWEMPTKTFPTRRAIAWRKPLVLPPRDRLEMNHLLIDLEQVQQRVGEREALLVERCGPHEDAELLRSIAKCRAMAFVSGDLRRNVGRAITPEKNDCNIPSRRQSPRIQTVNASSHHPRA